jgi:hypothetical protein
MADQRYDLVWLKFALLIIGLPFALAYQLLKRLLELVFPQPLRWEWDNVANVHKQMFYITINNNPFIAWS